jgi:hypothetical protein
MMRVHAKRNLELGVEIGSPRMRNLGLLHWGQSLLRDRQPREALSNLVEMRELVERYNLTREAEAANLCWLARAQAECGDQTTGEETAIHAVEAGVRNGTPFFEAVARLERARLLIDFNSGNRLDIADELSRAESLIDQISAGSIRPLIRFEQARLAKLNDDGATFRSLLGESRQLFADMEATGYLAMVDQLFEDER